MSNLLIIKLISLIQLRGYPEGNEVGQEEVTEKVWLFAAIDYIFEDILGLPAPRRILPPPPAELLKMAGVTSPAELFERVKTEIERAVKERKVLP